MFRVKATTKEGSGRIVFNFPHSSLLVEKGKTIFGRRGCHTKKQRNYPDFCGILTKILKVFGGKGIYSCHTLQLKSSFAQTTNLVITKRPELGEETPKRSRKGQSISTLSGCNFKGLMYRFIVTGTALQSSYWKAVIICNICGFVLRHKLNQTTRVYTCLNTRDLCSFRNLLINLKMNQRKEVNKKWTYRLCYQQFRLMQ